MSPRFTFVCLSSLLVLGVASPVLADVIPPPKPDEADPQAAPPPDAPTPAEEEAAAFAALKQHLGAIDGPQKAAALGDLATIDIPAGYWLVPQSGAGEFDRMMDNIPDPKAVGVLVKDDLKSNVYFTYDPMGYVADDEPDLDADALLTTMREGTAAQNTQRQQIGMKPIELVGWVKEPFYNKATKSLEWATSFREIGTDAPPTTNYNTRRLGRDGVMSVILATSPENLDAAVSAMNTHLDTFMYVPGRDYASFTQGDRVAEIGLGALVVGGGALALAKVGFFQKFWKILVGIGAVLVAGVAKLFGGRKKDVAAEPSASQNEGGPTI
jgi:uncharacterized membrane-anchored protein